MSDDCITSLDTEPEVSSKRELGEDVSYLRGTNSDLEEMVEDGETTDTVMCDKRTKSSKSRERRKTLEEYFLDSPPELAVENSSQVSALNLVQHYSFNSFLGFFSSR